MKKVFSYNADIDKNAYMNWRTSRFNQIHNMQVIAEGFFSSAITLAERILVDNHDKKADMLIFPILFNVNHSIEVYLKSICWTLNELLNTTDTFRTTHDLKKILGDVKELESRFEDKLNASNKIDKLESYIVELYERIESKNAKGKPLYDITFARYSLTRDLEPQFYINELDNVVIDIENFVELFQEIFNDLNNLSLYYLERLETRYEMESEFISEY